MGYLLSPSACSSSSRGYEDGNPHFPVHGRFSAPPRWLRRACCSAPDWLQTIAKINPLHHTVAGMRALFNATYGDGEIVVGLVVLVALTLVTFTLGARSFARSAA